MLEKVSLNVLFIYVLICILGIWKNWEPEEPSDKALIGGDGGVGGSDDEGSGEATTDNGEVGDGSLGSTNSSVISADLDLAHRKKVIVTNVSTTFTTFHAQEVAEGPKIEELLNRLREEAATNSPTIGAYKPKKGDLAMARFSEDGQWYRVKIEKSINANETQVLYIDYGNREVLPNREIASLPLGAQFSNAPPGAREYLFAFTYPDTDPDFVAECRAEFLSETDDKVLLLKTEYRDPTLSLDAATLVDEGSKKDVLLGLVNDGWLFVDTKTRRTGRLFKKWQQYKEAQETAKKSGVCVKYFLFILN